MKNEIKKGLLDATPDLQQSKERVRKAVLQPSKMQLMPRFVLGCFIILSIVLVSTHWKINEQVQGFSEETLNMYGLLHDADSSEEYQKDLLLAKYGELKGIEISGQAVKNLIASYEAELPNNFDKLLRKNGITSAAYKEQYLTLKAKVQFIRNQLLPQYEKMYPQFHQEIHAQLLLFDAVEEVDTDTMPFAATTTIPAIVLYEGENARVLASLDEKRLVEEQLYIMPIHDELTLKTGDQVLLENSFITSVQTKDDFKQFVVSQDIKVVTKDKTKLIPAMQKEVNTLFKQMTWQNISQSDEHDVQLKTASGLYSVWFRDGLVIGSGDKGFVISKEILKKWGEELIQ